MTREEEIHKIANTISTNIGKDVDEDYIYNEDGTKVLLADGIKQKFIESFKKAMEE